MKIAYFSCSAEFGGVEKIVCESLNELGKTDEVMLIVPKGCAYKNKLEKGVKIYEYSSFDKRYNIFLYIEILGVLRDFGAEILHSHGAKATQIGFVLSKFLKAKFVATKHNSRKGKVFNHVQNVIAVSNEVASTINHPSKVLYFGIKPQSIKAQKSEIFTITAVGRLDIIKGFDLLIKSASKLDFDYVLQIVGDGKERQNLERLIKELGLGEKVRLLGFCDNIPQILANSHLQVISSHKEGLPLALIEGIFYSDMVLSTPAGQGIAEILNQNFICSHENLSEKIKEIYENQAEFIKKFQKTHAKIKQNLTFENYILNLKKYYKGQL